MIKEKQAKKTSYETSYHLHHLFKSSNFRKKKRKTTSRQETGDIFSNKVALINPSSPQADFWDPSLICHGNLFLLIILAVEVACKSWNQNFPKKYLDDFFQIWFFV